MRQQSLNFLDRSESEKLRNDGIRRAVDHADQRKPLWRLRALNFLKRYPKDRFMAEDLREWSYSAGLETPPSCRAWGWVIKEAQRQGLIDHAGYQLVKNPLAHRTPASVWIKVN